MLEAMKPATLAVCWAAVLVGACYGASSDDDDDDTGGTGASAGSSSKGGGSSGASGTGGSSAGSSNGGSGKGGSSSAGTSAGGTGGSGSSFCPSEPPVSNSACDVPADEGLFVLAHCSWGDDPRPMCRTSALCSQNLWKLTEPDPSLCNVEPLPETCPASQPEQGSTCTDDLTQCWYDDGTRCVCSPCQGGSEYPICQTIDPPQWACITPMEGCPNPQPQAGEACDQEGMQCGHDCALTINCQNGAWNYAGNMCPICASPDTPIATPSGTRPIASLRVGELVYSVDHGAIVAVPIARTGSTPVVNHHVVRLLLGDGSVLEMSPGHPTADGRDFSSLLRGGALDEGHPVLDAELVPYEHERTYDILPASSTGSYFAAGALVGSTLAR